MTQITASWLNDTAAQRVCGMLTDAGYQAWFVGGCVRNALLDAPVADLDLSTDAHPDVVTSLAKSAGLAVVPTGISHGTVTVIAQNVPFEITTFRRDVATDGRRATVAFADNMMDDARRRDFTMNAIYVGSDGVVVDPLNGLPDLHARRVRFIEDADQRIKEDYLRILRYFRFHAWYGDVDAGPDPDALAACAQNIEGLQNLSSERVTSELLKLLSALDPAPAVSSMAATGGLAQIVPGANAAILAVLVHVEQQAGLSPDPLRRLVAMGGDIATLRLSNGAKKRLDQMRSSFDAGALGYYFGAEAALNTLAVRAASFGVEIDSNEAQFVQFAASQTFPLAATDLMPGLQGPALGQALSAAKTRWVASGFTLTKAELMDG